MGVWDSIKGGAGAAWDQTGGRAWDAASNTPFWDPDTPKHSETLFDFEPAQHTRAGRIAGGYTDLLGLGLKLVEYANPLYVPRNTREIGGWLTEDTTGAGPAGYTAENFDRPLHDAETDVRFAEFAPQGNDPFTRPDFDPTAITGPYGDYTTAANQAFDKYAAMLEGISTGPRTSRIEEMYGLATDEARRRMESADTWEATETARLDTSDKALDAALIGMQDKFYDRMTTIRGHMTTRQADTAELRDGLIEATAGELGEAGAAFLVSATRSGDILESQRTRNEQHMADMDDVYSMWSLDRTMQAAGMKQSARRDLADDVMAMRELVHQFSYDAGQAFHERMFVAEEGAAQRETDMLTTLAELGYGHAGQMADVGLQGALAVAGAEDAFNSQWDEAEAYWENPVTANAFFGMDPSMMGGADPQQMFENWLAIQQMQAGDDTGPIVIDPVYGAPWSGGYVIGPDGQPVFDPSGMGSIADVVDMTSGELVSNIYTPPGQ